MTQHEVTKCGPLLDRHGHLIEAGYSRYPLKEYDRSRICAGKLRIKEWDYYLVQDEHKALALTIADNGYMGMYSVSWLDFDKATETTKSVMTPFPMGKTNLPSSSLIGDVCFENETIAISFENNGKTRHLKARYKEFKDGQTLTADVLLSDEPKESMNIMTPYKEDPAAFYYNRKINCMKGTGVVTLGTSMYKFREKESNGVLDWGRGVWTYKNTWYWSSLSCTLDGHRFGWNLGYGFGDTSAATENVLFYDGKVHKLGNIDFGIPVDEGRDDFMSVWSFTDDEGRLQASFEPILDRAAYANVGIVESDQNQIFGRFTGKAVLDDGQVIRFTNVIGFAEKVFNKW